MRSIAIRCAGFLLAGTIALFPGIPQSEASDTPIDRATLKGIDALSVIAENVSAAAERDGLTQSQVQTVVESRLREAGIRVVSPFNPLLPYLYVRVDTRRIEDGNSAYSVSMEFKQSGALSRDPTIEHPAVVTWSVGAVGIVTANRVYEIPSRVTELADRFVTAYLEQNPK